MKNVFNKSLFSNLLVAACLMMNLYGYSQNNCAESSFGTLSSGHAVDGIRPEGNINGREMTDRGWCYYDDGNYVSAVGLTNGGSIYWGVMFPAGSYTGNAVTKVSMYDIEAHTGDIMIYQGGDTAPGTLVYTQAYACTGSASFIEWTLTTPVAVNPNQNLWIVMHNNDGHYIASVCNDTGDPNGRWISTDGTAWNDLISVNSSLEYTWMLRAYLETITSFSWDFESGMNGWTTIDADGDGYDWLLGSAAGGVYLVEGGSLAGSGHNASQDLMCSGSWTNMTNTVLYPDNYLVSPPLTLIAGSTFSFRGCAQDSSYASDHFGVFVSNNGTTNWSMVSEWTMTAKDDGRMSAGRNGEIRAQGGWHLFSVDLSGFAGTGRYVAIRHFNCSDQFLLDIDDVSLSTNTQYYNITTTSNPNYAGTATGGGSYASGSTCTIHATPYSGYSFVRWTKYGTQVSTNPNYSFTVTGDASYVAQFQQNVYTIVATANPANGGTVTGGGSYAYGNTCTLHATPNNGYTFVKWMKNGTQVSTSPDYSFTVTGNASYVAQFQQSVNNYTVNVLANPTYGGEVSGGGTFQQGQQCTVTATANEGYTFTNWTENGTVISNNASYTFTVTDNCILVANFQIQSYDITVTIDPVEGGTVMGEGTYNYGESCTLIATANNGYSFVCWKKNGAILSSNPVMVLSVTGNVSYVAQFAQSINNFTITASANPAEGGSVTGGGTYQQGEQCTLTALPNSDYQFVNWTKNGSVVSAEPSFTITVNENATYVANFMQNVSGYTISANANPMDGGIVIGAGLYAPGLNCTLNAIANEGYRFVNWTENGVIQWLTDQYEFVVDRDRIIIANFEALPTYTISAMAGANGSITPQGDVAVVKGNDQAFTMTPDLGGRIVKVLVDGIDIGPVESYTFTNVQRDHTIYVSFSGMGVEDEQDKVVEIYPNPAQDMVYVEGDGIKSMALYDMLGNCVRSMDFILGKGMNVSDLPRGTYMLLLMTKGGYIGYQKLLLN